MDRRAFVRGVFGSAAAVAALGAVGLNSAEAAPMPVPQPTGTTEAERVQGDYRPEVDGLPTTEKAQYYYYRRRYRPRRRVVYYRRPRRVVYYRRPVYYRPRRVYYRRYRPVYYRRRYW